MERPKTEIPTNDSINPMVANHSNPDMPMRLLSSDIDGTLLGNPASLLRFNATWMNIPQETRPLLCYNTGRLLDDALDLLEQEPLLQPDYIICGVGTTIYDVKSGNAIKSFHDILEEGWDLKTIESVISSVPNTSKQPKRFQNSYKSSWYLNGANSTEIEQIEELLESHHLNVHVIYSSGRDLDVIPKHANKGNALVWLIKHLNINRENVIVAGDTGNDSAMFHKRSIRGIVVGNAQPELHQSTVGLPVYRSEASFAEGILEGLLNYGVIETISNPDENQIKNLSADPIKPPLRQILKDTKHLVLSNPESDLIKEGYFKAIEGLRKCITPLGFAACSPEDNETSGTDENYRSVWARDGSITVIASLSLNDPDIRLCQKATLDTLLSNVSITGQVPANVSLDTQEPDYSGVGGICSIDSGLWLVIASFEYAKARQDFEFLRENRGVLQKVMDWLSAHDSNNDGLLEIPEASDWTDLFGRSYNVLYDENIWYKANVSFGRILEMCGEWRSSGDYLQWASVIRNAILQKFWPSIKGKLAGSYSFADQQTSIGDTQYLIAQVTPFDFDWRCDVYANIQAFLFDVLDIERAQKAFRFMWGVGVNQPFPVANLYPPVQAGDPGWRDYYTVNLLNLPNHYHNGGIWPFIGAQWVRFIHKLGLRELAANELYKLAKLNEQGINKPWEFNEWYHGQTGKPMGKSIQAWSCAEYIRACHELRTTLSI